MKRRQAREIAMAVAFTIAALKVTGFWVWPLAVVAALVWGGALVDEDAE
jgi:hypothetical protein